MEREIDPTSPSDQSGGSDNGWVRARDALTRFAASSGGPRPFKENVADALRDGSVKARAGVIFRSQAATVSAALKEGPRPETGVYQEVRPDVFRASKRWGQDTSNWRWPYDQFFVTTSLKRSRRTILRGVQLNVDDLEKLVAHENGGAEKKTRSGIGGAPKKEAAWDVFWFSVIQLAKEDRLDTDNYRSRTELRRYLLEQLDSGQASDYLLKESTIKPVVTRIWDRFFESVDDPQGGSR